jgi:hypothetical protein
VHLFSPFLIFKNLYINVSHPSAALDQLLQNFDRGCFMQLLMCLLRNNTAGCTWDGSEEKWKLHGAGHPIKSLTFVEKEAAIAVLEKHLALSRRAQVEEDWEAGELTADATTILRYTRASIAGVGAIGHLYGKVRKRRNCTTFLFNTL